MGKRVGRPRSCDCGECRKCKAAAHAKARWDSLTLEERRQVIARRDKAKAHAADRRRYERDRERILERNREWRRNNRDVIAGATKAWREAHPERIAEYTRAYRRANPEKAAAHTAVHSALRAGQLAKEPCEVCGATENIHAHHDDYSKPLEVRWLCYHHHRAEHDRQKAA